MKGKERFNYHLAKLEHLLIDSSGKPEPGEWLYKNNGRTSAFMLEALCKVYIYINDEEPFESLKKHFKLLEDAIGQMDYYVSFAESFEKDNQIDPQITAWVKGKSNAVKETLNTLLLSDKWIPENKRIEKTRSKLDEVKWLPEDTECVATEKFYHSSIKDIINFYQTTGPRFTDIELQVHSLRRKLRWLSIYPHAMPGMIRLKEGEVPADQVDYQTEEIVNSPYNQLPEGNGSCTLLLNKPHFISLSWVINALGKLKDEGLKHMLVKEASTALNLPLPEDYLPAILEKCSDVAAGFFQKKVLDNLIAGTAS